MKMGINSVDIGKGNCFFISTILCGFLLISQRSSFIYVCITEIKVHKYFRFH